MSARRLAGDGWVGRPIPRREDRRFLVGEARYVDDLSRPGMLHLALVRSPLAHARIRGVDPGPALGVPGVVRALTAQDLEGRVGTLPVAGAEGAEVAEVPVPLLAAGKVRFAGEPVAAVLAESRAAALDGVELVGLDLDPLPPVVDPRGALRDGVLLHEELGTNVLMRWRRSGGDVEAAFASARRVVRGRIGIPRLVAASLEPRGALAVHDPASDLLTVYCSAQDPHRPLGHLSRVLRRPSERLRVVVPDVGGAFGSKGVLAPEAALAAWLAMETGAPVKWVETRAENFLAAPQGRGLWADVELALDGEGRFLAVRARLLADLGAYLTANSAVPPVTAAMLLTGPYAVGAAEVEIVGVATSKPPTGPYRGAGRPEAALLVERMVDLAARELGIDRVELRRRNLIPPDRFPHRTPLGFEYDSGDYGRALDRACELIGYGSRRAPAGAGLEGVGVALYVERAGAGASGRGALWERAAVVVDREGRVLVRTGSTAHGQGHETTFAQVVADVLGLSPAEVAVEQGDSATVPAGVGTFASRSVTVGGSAASLAAAEVRAKALAIGARLLEVAPEDAEWTDARVRVRGAPERSVGLAEIAAAAHDGRGLRPGEEPGLAAEATFTLPGPVFPFGAYAARVTVDPETGEVDVREVVAVDDAGRIVNPLLAEGQVVGAAVQGLGEALTEEAVYDEEGQLLTGSFAQYGVLSAPEVPRIETEFQETPSPHDPLGAKGIGEAGAIGTPAAVANAVVDALAPLGVRHLDLPFTPERVLAAIRAAR